MTGRAVAAITGGASGFGLALGARCAERGMAVALLDRDRDRAAGAALELAGSYGVEAVGIHADVADASSVEEAVDTVSERLGGLDLAVSNVGVQLFGAVERLTDDEWRWVLDVNVVGAARFARAALPHLRRSTGGRLAFTASSSVLSPASRLAAYQASKFAIWGLAETLRLELADDGIEVSVVFPSGMASRHLETSAEAQPDRLRRSVTGDDDLDVALASNPSMAADVTMPEDAAAGVVEQLLDGERYVVTHGDLTGAVSSTAEALHRAARRAAAGT